MKKNFRNTLNEMKHLVKNAPRNITEAMEFDGEDMAYDEEVPFEDEMPAEEEPVEGPQNNGMDVDQFLDEIRRKSLQGMAQLAADPTSEQYQMLKKVWQLVDKAATDKIEKQQQAHQGLPPKREL